MVVLGEKFHAYANVAEIAFCPTAFRATLENGLMSADQCYLVAEVDAVIRGMAGAIVYPSYFNHAALAGQEMFWWSECAEGMRLHSELAAWAKKRGCKAFTMIALSDDRADRMARLYKRMGYRPVEQSFIKGL